MTETEKKALALLNEMRGCTLLDFDAAVHFTSKEYLAKTICRAIEQHEAFKREVSDAIDSSVLTPETEARLSRFIIPKPDPLVDAIREMALTDATPEDADRLRTALAARGLEVRKIGEGE